MAFRITTAPIARRMLRWSSSWMSGEWSHTAPSCKPHFWMSEVEIGSSGNVQSFAPIDRHITSVLLSLPEVLAEDNFTAFPRAWLLASPRHKQARERSETMFCLRRRCSVAWIGVYLAQPFGLLSICGIVTADAEIVAYPYFPVCIVLMCASPSIQPRVGSQL